ncbi:MAG: hypothetical protein MZV63_53845 [Marinilabiliales bacterium]|nr:hypothetical protein [Marinilabiliales bacterium]
MTGIDPADSKTAASEGRYLNDYTPFLKEDGLKGKRIGWYTSGTRTALQGRHPDAEGC